MKKVEKSPAIYTYTCEKCHTEFTTEVEAIECEKGHAETIGITNKTFEYKNKYPVSLKVRMSDGTVQVYRFKQDVMDDILHNVTSDGKTILAIVDGYNVVVQKEYVKDEQTVEEKLTGASVKLEDRKLYVDIPDDVQVLSTDTICVKVFDEKGNEITAESENSIFDEIVISAEVRQIVENECIKN